ncbi:coatomer subunit beta-1 [Raphanus sativus]|uniref:Coatomer subunit beta-1 n=1 Tax=Raphanus sativus TaxID=3726 RepID=A0A9W3C262_RAPSA|nr:coatomer subunit beta-1 [Raphanus sativus]
MDKSSTLLVHYDKGTPAVAKEIKEALEGNDVEAKVDAMKKAVMLLLNGETIPQLFITIIRYVLPSEDHTIQKLLLLYLELIEKTDSRGKVLPEMILICQNLRNNLMHPNEYIRGVTLRFLCRLKETEIVEPLTPSVLQNLEHRHPFVRRNAILAVMSIYKLPHGEQLFVDAPEMIEKALSSEQDPSAKRNAFLMLFTCAEERAVNYLLSNVDKVSDWNESLQMVVLELIRSVCKTKPSEKGKYIKIIISLLSATSSAVIYECAGTLVSLSSAPTAIRAAANTYCQLLLSQSDNNVKLILLDRLSELKSSHRDIMVELIIDVLRVLSSPNLDIRRKTLDIALDLITHHNINEVVQMLKKEVVKTQSGELEKNGEYRQMLIQAIHACAVKFPEVASTVVHLLMDFLGDSNVASALDVISFVREIIETNPKLRVSIITRLLDTFYQFISDFTGMSQLELEDQVQDDLKRATGEFTKDENDANKLNRILQLTGFSDPVYAEAYVTVHHYDIALEVTVINRTKDTLQNLCLELATMGDLKLVERPQNYSLAPATSMQIKANIKVSSTETGVIFGNIVYETSNVMERNVVVLNDIHIDIMDYISPAVCSDVAFRTMWAEFEWENKVAVNTKIENEREFLDHIIKSTNMKCLTAPSELDGECGFLAANLYAKSVFGEDALVNVSIEKQTDGALSGYIRIRSKTQGIALSLGDKITLKQKGSN